MPELPDIVVYLDALEEFLGGRHLVKVIVKSPFVLRSFDPPLESLESCPIHSFSRIGKRIVWHFANDHCLVFHLMIAGRFHWKPGLQRMPKGKMDLVAFQFEHGTMMLTEASKKKRASIHVVRTESELTQFMRKGINPLDCSHDKFSRKLHERNRTLKRALTDPDIFDGIGNAYSDEILIDAQLSPLKRTSQLSKEETERLYAATRSTLNCWVERLSRQSAGLFPEKVTAFRREMKAHGKYQQPCPECGTAIQRIRYAENECNYCPRCQTNGKLLADRSLSRLLKDDWPKTIEELEG